MYRRHVEKEISACPQIFQPPFLANDLFYNKENFKEPNSARE